MAPHAVEEAIERRDAELVVVKEATNRSTPEEAVAKEEKQLPTPEPIDLKNIPWLKDNGDCTVTIEFAGKERSCVLADPGMRHSMRMTHWSENMSAEDVGIVSGLLGRSIVELHCKAIRKCDELLIEEPGQWLPQPTELLVDHKQQWDEHDKEMRKYSKVLIRERNAFEGPVEKFLPEDDAPDPPRTGLEVLVFEELGTQDVLRIIKGFQYLTLTGVVTDDAGAGEGN